MSSRPLLRTLGRVSLAAGLVVALTVPASAQISKSKNAVKDLKAKSQLTVKETKVKLRNPKIVLGAQLSGFTKAVANGAAYGPDRIRELFEDMEDVQAVVSASVQEAVVSIRDHASMLLADISQGPVDPAKGIYPENFYRGDQGHLDTFHFNVREIVRKSLKLTRHRMRKLAKSLRKNTTIDLTSVVGPRLALPALVVGEGVVDPVEEMLMVDLLMAHSDSNFEGDGFLHASGSANPGEGTVTVELYDITGTLVASENSVLDGNNRWIVHFSELGEGNYQVLAKQGGHLSLSEIGVR